jgi:hypothetical protein
MNGNSPSQEARHSPHKASQRQDQKDALGRGEEAISVKDPLNVPTVGLGQSAPSTKILEEPAIDQSSPRTDPFGLLGAYKRFVFKLHPEYDQNRSSKYVGGYCHYINREFCTKLIDLKSFAFSFDETATRDLVLAMKSQKSKILVFQNLKIFNGIEDSELNTELPICLVQADLSINGAEVEPATSLMFSIKNVKYPIKNRRGFQGVRLENADWTGDEWLSSITCGFISKSGVEDERYKLLEYAHLIYTVPHRTDL